MPQRSADPARRAPRRRAAANVLVLEDERDQRESLAEWLRARGHQVAEAATGPEAIARLLREDMDLVLLDQRLPGMSGNDVLALLRRTHPRLPVIFVTATPEEVGPCRCRVLQKPVDLRALEQAMAQCGVRAR